MVLDENEIYIIAKKFRIAIEKTNFSIKTVGNEGYLRMKDFPKGTCSEVCKLFGIYLSEKYGVNPLIEKCGQIENNCSWYGSHHWLEYNGIIIDIDADQFPMVNESVIVKRISMFHERYAHKKGILTTSFSLMNESDWMIKLYKAILKTLSQSEID